MTENSNVLAGIKCPVCESSEPFYITVTCSMRVYDDGTDEYSYVEWSPESGCVCQACDHSATVADFTKQQSGHDVQLALEAKTDNEAIGSILHLQYKLNLTLDLCNAAITAHRLGNGT